MSLEKEKEEKIQKALGTLPTYVVWLSIECPISLPAVIGVQGLSIETVKKKVMEQLKNETSPIYKQMVDDIQDFITYSPRELAEGVYEEVTDVMAAGKLKFTIIDVEETS